MVGIAGWSLVAVLFVGAAISAGLSVYSWRQTATLARVQFAGLTTSVAAWELLYAVALLTPPGRARLTMEGMHLVVVGIIAAVWVLFGLAYAGRPEWAGARTLALLLVPVGLLAVAVVVEPTGSLLWRGEMSRFVGLTVVDRQDFTLGMLAYLGYSYAMVVAGMLLVFRHLRAYGSESLYTSQNRWMAVAAVPPAVAGVADAASVIPEPGLRLTPFVVPLTMVAFSVALFRHNMTGLTPGTGRVGRETALRDLADPVIVTDGDGRVADINGAAAETFGVSRKDALGVDLAAVVGADDDAHLEDGTTVRLRAADRRRRFEVRASSVSGATDRQVGRALVFRDVTRQRLREQRLEVLNRVVRHNLRNDMNTVAGYAEVLSPHVDEGTSDAPIDGEQYLERIQAVSQELVDLGEKVRDFERTITGDTGGGRVEVAPTLRHVADEATAEYDGQVTVDVPPDLSLVTDGAVLEMVVYNAVENALEHAGDAPTVRVTGRRDGDRLRLTVEDDGPGIPDDERRALEAGTESPLEHGSGLGLWIVVWGTEWLGGEVVFDCDDGTTVAVHVPDETASSVSAAPRDPGDATMVATDGAPPGLGADPGTRTDDADRASARDDDAAADSGLD